MTNRSFSFFKQVDVLGACGSERFEETIEVSLKCRCAEGTKQLWEVTEGGRSNYPFELASRVWGSRSRCSSANASIRDWGICSQRETMPSS